MLTYVKHSGATIDALTLPDFSLSLLLTNMIKYLNVYPELYGVILVDRHDNSVYATVFVSSDEDTNVMDIDTQTLRPLVIEMKRNWTNLNGKQSQLYTAPIPSVNRCANLSCLPEFLGRNHLTVLYLNDDSFLAIPVLVEDDAMTSQPTEVLE